MVTTPEFQTLPPKTEDFTTGLSISYPSSNATFWFTVYPTDGGIKFLNLDVLKPASPYTYSAAGFPPMVITVDNELKTLTYSQQAATTSIPVSISSSASNAPSSAAASNAPSSAAASNQPTSIGPSQTGSRPTNTTGSQSTKPTNSSDGLSGGAVAGVAIGCLIVGAVIAGLLVWFCLGKRRKTQHARDSEASTLALMPREKGPIAKAISLEGGSPITASLDNALPQPLEDAAISGEISKISNLIKNHVQSFYHTGRGSPGLLDFDDIQALGHDLPLSTGTLSTLLTNSATREMALRFCIAWVVISRMQPLKELNTNLLPPEVSQCFQAMSFVDRGSKVHALLMARWRAITAELMQSAYVRNPFAPSDSRNANIQAATSILNSVLQPFADSRMDNQQRKQNLEEILKRSALFAFTLFSQPSSWDFDWQDKSEVKSGNLCVFPALVQVTDETGELVRPPRAFNEAVVRRLDE